MQMEFYRPLLSFFFLNDTATTEIYTLSLHDALPICPLHSPQLDVSFAGASSTLTTALTRAAQLSDNMKQKRYRGVEWSAMVMCPFGCPHIAPSIRPPPPRGRPQQCNHRCQRVGCS